MTFTSQVPEATPLPPVNEDQQSSYILVHFEPLVWPEIFQIDELQLDQLAWKYLLTLSEFPLVWDSPHT
jgi:hypothetical protein